MKKKLDIDLNSEICKREKDLSTWCDKEVGERDSLNSLFPSSAHN